MEDLTETILEWSFFNDSCPLEFSYDDEALNKAQEIFYADDGEYCENNCDECYKKCWIKYFKELKKIKGE